MSRASRHSVSPVRLINGLCIASLSMSMALSAAAPAQANLIQRIKDVFNPNSELGSATGTRRGGGSRDICAVPTASTFAANSDTDNMATDAETTAVEDEDSADDSALVAFAPWTNERVSDGSEIAAVPASVAENTDPASTGAEVEAVQEAGSTVPEEPVDEPDERLMEGKTLEEYPSLSVYVPFTKVEDNAHLEFSISNTDTLEYVAGPFDVELPEQPSLVTIQTTNLPPAEDADTEVVQFTGLEPDIIYEWTVTLRCNAEGTSSSLQSVHGLISLTSAPELASSDITDYSAYLERALWYDMIAQLSATKDENPEEWSGIVAYLGLEDEVTAEIEVTSVAVPAAPPAVE